MKKIVGIVVALALAVGAAFIVRTRQHAMLPSLPS
jgi:hypothetical protein